MGFVRLFPVLVGIVALFALYQLVWAVLLATQRYWPFAALYLGMAIGGGALARALWANRKKLARPGTDS